MGKKRSAGVAGSDYGFSGRDAGDQGVARPVVEKDAPLDVEPVQPAPVVEKDAPLDVEPVQPAPVVEKDARPDIEGLVTSLFLRWPNPRLVSVMVDGAVFRCRVKDRALFAPGMRIPVRMIEQGLYECQGTPRARGRWA
jgi:hypothetical protein